MLNTSRSENNEFAFFKVSCSSSRQSIGNGAEFIVNGVTVEHIYFDENKCYHGTMEKCITDHCQCLSSDNIFIHGFKDKLLASELIVGCQMRFHDNKTSTVIKVFVSHRFNGTESFFHKYDVQMLKQDIEKTTDKNENNQSL
ncbi:Hypothetical predicted protein, partial [Mytilus galloprovincialis]